MMEATLVATIEGPLGKADLYEVTSPLPSGALGVEYEVRTDNEIQRFPSLGPAYIAAGELTGSKT